MKKIKDYFRDSIKEFNNITWPTKKQAVRISFIVFTFMLISAAVLGIVDEILAVSYKAFIKFAS